MKVLLGIYAFFLASTLFARDPLGEVANYDLDKARDRTSSMVKSGVTVGTVAQKINNEDGTVSYDVTIDYDMKVSIVGRQTGTEVVRFPAEFFTEEFLVKLRQTGYYEGPDFKVKHEGFADARTMDGHFFPHCDKLFIYDIKRTQGFDRFFGPIAEAMLNTEMNPSSPDGVQNMELRAHVFYGIPVLGGVKIDMTGKMSGFNIKTGFDYVTP